LCGALDPPALLLMEGVYQLYAKLGVYYNQWGNNGTEAGRN